MIKRIDLLRHGEPVGGRRYRGQIDDPLSDKGWQEMRAAVVDKGPWDYIVYSPLGRCADYANELALKLDIPLTADPRLKEIGFGEWEGLTGNDLSVKSEAEKIIRNFDERVKKIRSLKQKNEYQKLRNILVDQLTPYLK